ncbi:MAG TPA: class A beta-lactamase [Longimicrobium sp.]|nr:class A beta-lactamase [Longimicrobium sp.]
MRLRFGVLALALAGCEPAPDPDYRGQNTTPVEGMSVDSAAADSGALDSTFAAIERETGGELGVTATVVENGRTVSYRGGERFPMASTFKVAVAMAVLARVDSGRISLDDSLEVLPRDFRRGPSQVADTVGPRGGRTTVRTLVRSILLFSDNTATDALLRHLGGPAMVQAHLASRGIQGISVDRSEGEVLWEYYGVRDVPPDSAWTRQEFDRRIAAVPAAEQDSARVRFGSDPGDTGTPDGWAQLLIQLQRGDGLSPESREFILDAMRRTQTGVRRIRAGVPPGTEVADKTGTLGGSTNDVGLVTLPDGTHLALAVFVRNTTKSSEAVEPALAAAARAAYGHFAGQQAGAGVGGPGQGAAGDSTARSQD